MKKYEKITYPDCNQMAYQVKKDLEDSTTKRGWRRIHMDTAVSMVEHARAPHVATPCPLRQANTTDPEDRS